MLDTGSPWLLDEDGVASDIKARDTGVVIVGGSKVESCHAATWGATPEEI